jgi:hypothetical protein
MRNAGGTLQFQLAERLLCDIPNIDKSYRSTTNAIKSDECAVEVDP